MNPFRLSIAPLNRRQFSNAGLQLGGLALGMLAGDRPPRTATARVIRASRPPHFPPKAKSLIYLHMNGGPTQLDLWDYKPQLRPLRRQSP